jgi:glycosyltransferase involved in cell wall biosynthesis
MNPTNAPFVSVLIPVRNEALHIAACLRSLLEGTYPRERMEIFVIDGQSTDDTRKEVALFSSTHPNVHLLDNPHRTVPHAMNTGIRASRGDFIVRVDAHAHFPPDYIEQLVTGMQALGADNVGGTIYTLPGADTRAARAVALILSHPFGVGNSQFRTASPQGIALEVDTVPFGCYRRETFQRIGLFDEVFVRNQDDELNARLKRAGGRIYLLPSVRIGYVARDSLRKMTRMLFQYGYFKPLVAIKLGRPATIRQLAPPAFVTVAVGLAPIAWVFPAAGMLWAGTLLAHCVLNSYISVTQARQHDWGLFPFLFAGYLLGHLAYGAGFLTGLLNFGLLRQHNRKVIHDAPLSR